jgi:FkbM family methyltransferase
MALAHGIYEPEIDWLLASAAERPYSMIDAGANYGYWSIVASSAPYGRHFTIAVEPSRINFGHLLRNAAANGNRFQTLRRAVWNESNTRATLYGKRPGGLSLLKEWHPDENDTFEANIETITLDAIADLYLPVREYPVLVKLDVEGSEAEGIQGARRLLQEGALIIYEDHGKEIAHPASRLLLSLAGMHIFSFAGDQRVTQITTIDQVGAIKTNPRAGYNFFACRECSPWASLFQR